MYRGRLMSVPSMFFIFEDADVPLFNIDVNAWRTLAQVTGDLPLPPPEEMRRFNMETLLHAMHDPIERYLADGVSLFCVSVCYFITLCVICWFTNLSLSLDSIELQEALDDDHWR